MNLFTRIPDAEAITYSGGVYKQVEVYERGDRLYVKHGSGFARIDKTRYSDYWGTSVPKLIVMDLPHFIVQKLK